MTTPWRASSAVGLLAIACGGSPREAPPSMPSTAVPRIAPAASVEVPAPARKEPGARELVQELDEHDAVSDPDERWTLRTQTFGKIRELADPRGADALHAYLERAAKWPDAAERIHFRTQAALALAELGDLRAVPALAERLALDPLQVYSETSAPQNELRRSDIERVVCARLIADLADLHPEQRAAIRAQAEKAVWAWVTDAPAPHGNGLRALAKMKSDDRKIREQLRRWADPARPLPARGAQPPFPEEFVIAQSALRYLGAIGDAKAYSILTKQLGRRPPAIDVSMDAMMQGPIAVLGMALRGLAVGACDGLSELGDSRAVPALLKLVSDNRENEDARMSACRATVWLASEQDAIEIGKRIESARGGADKATHFRAACWLSALAERPLSPVQSTLFGFVETGPPELREHAARALGKAGLAPEQQRKAMAWLSDSTVPARNDAAALALLLGGSVESAKHVIEARARDSDPIRDLYSRSFASISHEDLRGGRLFRWVRNARAAGDSWAARLLQQELVKVVYDSGPHSLTRVVLRRRLFDLAQRGSPDERKSAIAALELMQARGALLALDELSEPRKE